MKITVVYGEHVLDSRERCALIVKAIKRRGWAVTNIDPKRRIAEQLTTDSLFGEEVLYVLEGVGNFLSQDFEWMKKKACELEVNLLVWHKGNVPAGIIKKFPEGTKLEKFEVPRIIFRFLESIYPGNTRRTLTLLHEILEGESVEFVLAMMARWLRDLYICRLDSEELDYPSWRMGKLRGQAGNFEEGQLEELIGRLASADVAVKTGGVDLWTSLDLIIAGELE